MTEKEFLFQLKKIFFCQSSKDILDIFRHLNEKIKFPYELEKKYFFENFLFFLKKNDNKISAINRTFDFESRFNNLFNSITKEEQIYTYKFIILLIELYYKNLSQEYNKKLIKIINNTLSNINIQNLPIDKIEKLKPFSNNILNNSMLKKSLFLDKDRTCIYENNIIFILGNELITDDFEDNNIKFLFNAFLYNKKSKNKSFIESYEKILKNNYPNLYNSKVFIISIIRANQKLENIHSNSSEDYSWKNLIQDYNMDEIYNYYKLIYPEEGFLHSFLFLLGVIKNKKINIVKKENIFETIKEIFSLCKPDFFHKKEDSISLHKILLYFGDKKDFNILIKILQNNNILIDYKSLFIESINKYEDISLEIIKEFKSVEDFYSFSKQDINNIWSNIIRNNKDLLLNEIINIDYFPKIEYKLILTFYGNSFNLQLNKFNNTKSLIIKNEILSFHQNLFLYIKNAYKEKDKKELINFLYKNKELVGELFSLIEQNILNISSAEQKNLKRRI